MIKRWIIRGIFILLLALCVAGWLWSGPRSTSLKLGKSELDSLGGVVHLSYIPALIEVYDFKDVANGLSGRDVKSYILRLEFTVIIEDGEYYAMGLGYQHKMVADGVDLYMISIPYWFLIALAGGALFFMWRKTRSKVDPANAFPVQPGDAR